MGSRDGVPNPGSASQNYLEIMGDSLDQERAKQNQKLSKQNLGSTSPVGSVRAKPKMKSARPRLNTSPIRAMSSRRDADMSDADGNIISLSARSIGVGGGVAAAYKSLGGRDAADPLSQFKTKRHN